MSATATTAGIPSSPGPRLVGRTFLHPAYDYLVIGGGLSVLFTLYAVYHPGRLQLGSIEIGGQSILMHHWVLFLCNSTHLAASTVRLYLKPGAVAELPRLTLVTPLIGMGLLLAGLLEPERVARNAFSLYQTWSPFHYAAQAYGLSVMYAMRSGASFQGAEKRVLRQVCLLPFYYAIIRPTDAGLGWILPAAWLDFEPVYQVLSTLKYALPYAIFAGPVLMQAWLWRAGRPLPWICPLVVLSNGIWWTILPYEGAFTWSTVFHSMQYLGIAIIFHVRDQMARPGNTHGRWFHGLSFYASSVVLAYALLYCLPQACKLAGFSLSHGLLLVIALVNIHHFVVDAFIWRLSRGPGNRAIVEGAG